MEVLEVFPCEKCGKTFNYIYALKRHKKSCGATKPTKCKKCLRWFDNQLIATRHELRCFNDNTPHACTFCNKTFERLYMLRRHYRVAHHIKVSALKKPNSDAGRFIECNFSDNEERYEDTYQHQQNDTSQTKPAVYTIEIESLTETSEVDSSVQTLVYKIRQTTDLAEAELLPECIIPDFYNVLKESSISHEEDETNSNMSQVESHEKDIIAYDTEYLESTEYYGIE